MIAILGYGFLALLCMVVLVALLMWWDFCVWRRRNGDRLSRSHWLTDGDYPTCDERTGEPVTTDDGRGAL